MGALSKIMDAGFTLSLVSNKLSVKPHSKLTPVQLDFLKLHKAEIIDELMALELMEVEVLPTVICGDCLSYKPYHANGQGAGLCLVSAKYGYSCWSSSKHQCEKFNDKIQVIEKVMLGDTETVTCYTPNGQSIEVEARDPEHATWLQKMNPKRV